MTFHCVAEGNPGPQYLWTRGRQDSLVQVAISMFIAILIIIIKALLLFMIIVINQNTLAGWKAKPEPGGKREDRSSVQMPGW